MTLEYEFLEKWKLVLVKITGIVTFKEMAGHLTSLSKDPRYVPPMRKLIDLRECLNYSLTREQAEKLAALNRELIHSFKDERCAIVAPGDLAFGMSRAHEMYTSGSGLDIQVFRKLRDALEWLGISSDELN